MWVRRSSSWRLQWQRPPIPACGPEQIETAGTCPCTGFAYGEMGELDLVRRREGHPDERFALTPLFREEENPGTEDQSHRAVLQRWPVLEADFDRSDSTDLAPIIRARAPARVMMTGDYNHDGAASEFLLQVGTSPCGKREAVLIGVSRADSALHAFSSVAHPERPLVLEINLWEHLRRSRGKITGVEWACGDHASETETVVQLWLDEGGLNGERVQYECIAGRGRGRVVSSERI